MSEECRSTGVLQSRWPGWWTCFSSSNIRPSRPGGSFAPPVGYEIGGATALVVGDFNVIPEDDDVWSVKAMAGDALMQPESRAAYARFLTDGWTDALRTHNPRGGVWTYWDYQAGAWQRDHGFRIDHILLSPECADRLEACGVDKAHRGREKASDHAPVWVRLSS